jgi:hypothetical protein
MLQKDRPTRKLLNGPGVQCFAMNGTGKLEYYYQLLSLIVQQNQYQQLMIPYQI